MAAAQPTQNQGTTALIATEPAFALVVLERLTLWEAEALAVAQPRSEGQQGSLGFASAMSPASPPATSRSRGVNKGNGGVQNTSPRVDFCLGPRIHRQLMTSIRTLRHVVLKRTANAHPLFGAGSKLMSLVVTLKRSSSKPSALRIALPHPLLQGQSEKCQLTKVDKKRFVLVRCGWGSMPEECLVENAEAALAFLWTALDKRLIHEVQVREVDGLVLPVWNRLVWERGRKHSASRINRKSTSMPPPNAPPGKLARTVCLLEAKRSGVQQ